MHQYLKKLHDPPDPFCLNMGTHRALLGEHYPPHWHDVWELVYIRTGRLVCQQGEQRQGLHSGMAILHPPGIIHADIAEAAYTTWFIMFRSSSCSAENRLHYDDDHHSLERLCHAIVTEWQSQHPQRDEMLAVLNQELQLRLNRSADTPKRAEQDAAECAVLVAEQMMETSYRRRLTVAEMADQAHVSVASMHAHFARLRGYTPMEFLQAARLRHAIVLLHHSTLTLDAVADLCGYHSPSHLSRHVKSATGHSPGQLRRDGIGKQPA